MTDTIQYSAGWGRSAEHMSDAVRSRIAQADREYERQTAAEERDRAARAQALQASAINAAMDAAVQRGEAVSVAETWRTSGANVGRTRGEALAYYSAVQDLEDARLRRTAQREIDQVGIVEFYASHSADTTAPHPGEIAGTAETLQRINERRARRREIQQVARATARADRLLGRTA